MYRILEQQGIKVKCFCDNKTGGQVDIQTLEFRLQEEQLMNSKDFTENLSMCVLMNSKYFTENLSIDYLRKNTEKYKKVYTLLDDEYLREVYLSMMKIYCGSFLGTGYYVATIGDVNEETILK